MPEYSEKLDRDVVTKPLNVGKMIEHLRSYPPGAIVLIPGYEGAYEPIDLDMMHLRVVARNFSDSSRYEGEYDTLFDKNGPVQKLTSATGEEYACVIERNT